MKGNLLIDIDSFCWNDLTIDRTNAMNLMFEANDLAREYGDELYGHPNLWNIELTEGSFFHDIFSWTEDERHTKLPWLGDIALSSLTFMFNYSTTDCKCENLADMDVEFENGLNGIVGCLETKTDSYVKDEVSWYNWHRNHFISNPPDRNSFVKSLSPFFPNLHFNPNSVTAGLNGLHTSHEKIIKTILYHLAALNDEYFPKFKAEPHLGGDGVCDYLQELYKSKELKIGASRDKNTFTELNFEFKEPNGKTKKLYCDLHTKFWDYFESGQTGYNASGNRIYFHQPIAGYFEGKIFIWRIGKHADR